MEYPFSLNGILLQSKIVRRKFNEVLSELNEILFRVHQVIYCYLTYLSFLRYVMNGILRANPPERSCTSLFVSIRPRDIRRCGIWGNNLNFIEREKIWNKFERKFREVSTMTQIE